MCRAVGICGCGRGAVRSIDAQAQPEDDQRPTACLRNDIALEDGGGTPRCTIVKNH